MVLPGNYTAKLKVGTQTFEKPFEVLVDPKLEEDGISLSDMKEQLVLLQKVMDLLSEARKLQDKVEEKIKELEKTKADEATLEPYKSALKKLKNDEGAYPRQVMVAQVSYLYYILDSGDKEPGQEEKDRYQELLGQFNQLKQGMKF